MALISEAEPEWQEFTFQDVQVYIDPISAMYLDGLEVGYHESLTETGFSFHNPNVRTGCGCGKSFSV